MDIICILLKKDEDASTEENLVVLLHPLINIMLLNEDVALQIHSSITLKTFIIYNKPQIVKM